MKTVELIYEGPLSEGEVKVAGGRLIAFERGKPVELPAESAEALLKQDPEAWKRAKPARGSKGDAGAKEE